jgi:hypothetical protein
MPDIASYLPLAVRRTLACVVVASAAIIIGAQPAGANEDELELRCRSLLQRSVFNCGCTTEFLEQHLSMAQADIVLRLWVIGANAREDNRELSQLYARYGRETIDDAVMRFHAYRGRLRLYCPQGDFLGIAD